MQYNGQQRFVDLDFSVVFDESELAEFVHKEVYARDRVVPAMLARVSWETFGRMRSGFSKSVRARHFSMELNS